MKYNEILNCIRSLGNFSHKAELTRIKTVCEKLGNPQNKFKAIHIAGTNGKGSVCTFVSSALKSAGYKVGTFVSPYIIDFCERIQINGEFISQDDLCRISCQVIDTGIALTEFEFITAVGFLYFAENKIDVVVLETGLGGRLDATNVIKEPLVSVITKIGLDHTALLGNTISEIAREKCGIIKGENVVTSPYQTDKALSVIKEYAPQVKIPDLKKLTYTDLSLLGNTFVYDEVTYKTALGGEFQIENALIAIETLKNCGLKITTDKIKLGLETAFIPARLEIVSKKPLTVIDGAHNPDGANALSNVLSECKNVTAIVGVMADKNYDQVLKITLPYCTNVICVKPNVPRALDVDVLSNTAKKYCKNVFVADTLQNALTCAKQKCGGGSIFIFGSLYLASEIRPILKG